MSDHARIEALINDLRYLAEGSTSYSANILDSAAEELALLAVLQQFLETVKGERDQWRPIEAAPKSANAIIVYAPHYSQRVVPATWDDDDESEGGQCWRAADALWDRLQPTHWMPLPSSPLVEPATPQSAGATKVAGLQEADAPNLPSALLRERPQDGVLGFVDRAVVADFQRRVEQTAAREGHRCSGCGHRWEDDPNLRGVELCGECWRKGQSAIFSRESAMSQNAGATKPEGSQAVGAQSLSSSLLTLVEQWRRDAANLERICSADRACDYTGWEGEVDKIRACARELESALLRERPQEPTTANDKPNGSQG